MHVIHPIGFEMDEKACRRAGLDYWHLVDCVEHASWEAFLQRESPARMWLLSARASTSYDRAEFIRGDYLLFGKESSGVDPAVQAWFASTHGADKMLSIPIPAGEGVRSLNLATAVAVVGYEGLRQVSSRA